MCTGCGEIHYLNPKVVVGAVCRWQDRVLLCRRAIEPRAGFWVVPAGYLERGESTEEGARREAWEEAGARIDITGLLAVYNVVRIGQVQLFYGARLLDPQVRRRARDAGARPVRLARAFRGTSWRSRACTGSCAGRTSSRTRTVPTCRRSAPEPRREPRARRASGSRIGRMLL